MVDYLEHQPALIRDCQWCMAPVSAAEVKVVEEAQEWGERNILLGQIPEVVPQLKVLTEILEFLGMLCFVEDYSGYQLFPIFSRKYSGVYWILMCK